MMSHILLQKQKGSAGVFDLFPMMILLVLSGCLILFVSAQMDYLHRIGQLEQLASQFILKMESTNGLTGTDCSDLYLELEKLGYSHQQIDLSGTTFRDEQIAYGDSVHLCLKVIVPYRKMSLMSESLAMVYQTEGKEVEIRKCTLALGI